MNKINMLGIRLALRWAFCALAIAGLFGPSTLHAHYLDVLDFGGNYRILVGGQNPETMPLSGTVPDGAGFTITNMGKTPGGTTIYRVTSTVNGQEPSVERQMVAAVAAAETMGVLADGSGELGYALLADLGPANDASLGGSTFAVGISGGTIASYKTQPGDTFQTITNNLVSYLDANGVNAFISSRSLEVISNISDEATLTGAVTMQSDDPGFQLQMTAGTVPEPSTFALLSIGVISLLAYGWRQQRKAA
jgi:hypothetical protein